MAILGAQAAGAPPDPTPCRSEPSPRRSKESGQPSLPPLTGSGKLCRHSSAGRRHPPRAPRLRGRHAKSLRWGRQSREGEAPTQRLATVNGKPALGGLQPTRLSWDWDKLRQPRHLLFDFLGRQTRPLEDLGVCQATCQLQGSEQDAAPYSSLSLTGCFASITAAANDGSNIYESLMRSRPCAK